MDDLRNDPEYEIRWPSDILAAEMDRLIARGRAGGLDTDWQDAVETLLRQAFTSPVPQREFGEQWNQSARTVDTYGEAEPF